jgi:hypothetical protein
MRDDVRSLVTLGGGGMPNMVVFIPLVTMAIVYLGTLASLRKPAKEAARRKVDRPRPPVDLPFE